MRGLLLRLYEERGPDCFAMLDGVYALAITDPVRGLVLARDPIGARPLYTGRFDGKLIFASEMKALSGQLESYDIFPPGCWQQPGHDPVRFRSIEPETIVPIIDLAEATAGVLDRLRWAIQKRLLADGPVGVYLSGGLDSSLIAALTVEQLPGVDTFAVGMADSEDIRRAREVAEYLGTNHHEFIFETGDMVEALPDAIRSLESYDAPLVRSAVPNYFLARLADNYVRIVFSGEGADELFAGYDYMTGLDAAGLYRERLSALTSLHQLGLQRGDRMSMAHGIEVHAPFLDEDLTEYAFRLPPELVFGPAGEDKWVLRIAGAGLLPEPTLWRRKQKFSHGAGSAEKLAEIAANVITDAELAEESRVHSGHRLTGKEELMYYRLFKRFFPEEAAERALGFSIGL